MKNIPKLIIALLALTIHTLAGQVFQYGPSAEYVSDSIPFSRLAEKQGTGPFVSTNAFSDTQALSPTTAYNGPKVYGGYQFMSSTYDLGLRIDQSNAGQGMADNLAMAGGYDSLYFNVIGSNVPEFHATQMSFASVFLFKQEDFNNGFKEGNIAIDGFHIGYAKTASGAAASYFNPEGRWLVQVDGTYYLSSSTFSLPAGNTYNQNYSKFSLTNDDLKNTLWAVYDPYTDLFFDGSLAEFDSLVLENVTAAGFYFDDLEFQSTAGTVGMRLGIGEFSISGSVIPEPSVAALLFAGGGLILLILKRKTNQV